MNEEALERLFGARQEELALQFEKLCERNKRAGYRKDSAFIKSSLRGTDGVLYGSFKDVPKSELEGRSYRWEHWDGKVTIHWLDVLHDPRTRQTLTKEA